MKLIAASFFCLTALALPASAAAWSPLRGENANAKKGNELMAEGQYGPALQAYDEAARELPDARGVQLNRGLALLAQDLDEQAKEAFLAAADPSASPSTRAAAYYDLGVAYAREGNSISEKEEYEQASAQFREAADAFKRALRVQPGNRDAAWNLEYAMKRIREEEEKQQQQDQEQNQDKQNQDEQNQDEQNQDKQNQDKQEQNKQEQNKQEQNKQEQNKQEQNKQEQPMPQDDVQRFLDALEQNEQNLPLQRARRRSAGRPPPEKDW
jgi:Ca-activated chloride channel family protein